MRISQIIGYFKKIFRNRLYLYGFCFSFLGLVFLVFIIYSAYYSFNVFKTKSLLENSFLKIVSNNKIVWLENKDNSIETKIMIGNKGSYLKYVIHSNYIIAETMLLDFSKNHSYVPCLELSPIFNVNQIKHIYKELYKHYNSTEKYILEISVASKMYLTYEVLDMTNSYIIICKLFYK